MASKMTINLCHHFLPVTLGIMIIINLQVSSRPVDLSRGGDGRHNSSSSSSLRRSMFHEWMALHGKSYPLASEEYERRFEIFKENVNYIEAFNAKPGRSYELGINPFTDLTKDEFSAIYASGLKSVKLPKPKRFSASAAEERFRYESETDQRPPDRLSWIAKGATTKVKNQGRCGCCWAFSAVAAVESLNKIKTGKLVSLSEQELLDCAVPRNVEPCTGYSLEGVFTAITGGGLNTDTDYPYTAIKGNCNLNSARIAAKIAGYKYLYPGSNETALLEVVAMQPVSVGISASSPDFRHYLRGVFDAKCDQDNRNHAVTVVGYGQASEAGVDYWTVKNSWGVAWGSSGYMKIQRGRSGPKGHCGMAVDAYYPIWSI